MLRFVVRLPDGEMVSQFLPPLGTDALAVKLVCRDALTDRVADFTGPFTVPVNANEVGLTPRLLVRLPPPSSARPTDVQTTLVVRAAMVRRIREYFIRPFLMVLRAVSRKPPVTARSEGEIRCWRRGRNLCGHTWSFSTTDEASPPEPSSLA